MALASTRPVVGFAETVLQKVADLGGGTPAAWWMTILSIGPVLGSVITEPAAMTISALLLATSVLRSAAERPIDVRDARSAVRERIDRWDIDPLRGTSSVDGGSPVGVGLRCSCCRILAGAPSSPFCVSNLTVLRPVSEGDCVRLSARPPQVDVDQPDEAAPLDTPALLPVPAWVVGGSHPLHRVDGAELALPGDVHRRVPVLPRVRAGDRRLPEPGRVAHAAAGRVLPRRPGDSWRAAGVVDRRRCSEPAPSSRSSSVRRC